VAAESSVADEATCAAWARDEPALRAEIATLEAEWRERGYREEYEVAQATIAALGVKDPRLQWDRWSRNFDFFLDSQMDLASQAAFCPTTYSPGNVVDSSGWLDFRLTGAEVDQLIKDAPEELRTRLGQASADTIISAVSFTCTTVGVKRPWLDENVFRTPIWRFADQARRLSDGGSPPRGEWPYYVSGLVLVRNVAVVTSSVPPPGPQSGPDVGPVVRDHRGGGIGGPGRVIRPRPVEEMGRPMVRDHRSPAMTAAPFAMAMAPTAAPPVAAASDAEGRFDRRLVMSEHAVAKPRPETMAALRAAQVQRLDRPIPAVASLAPVAGAPLSLTDEVLFLAVICKPLQECPNPDLTLFAQPRVQEETHA
jgi:hypothetical protein